MSPAAGIDYINTHLPYYIDLSKEDLAEENFASAIAQGVPRVLRNGNSDMSLVDAYDAIVHELKERRYDPWQRNETIKLVRAYLVCLDELTVLSEIFSKKFDFFQRLRNDCSEFPELKLDPAHVQGSETDKFQSGESTIDRIGFAEHVMGESSAQCKQLSADLRESLNSLFQLRSIEQNERAIIADTQNKAIFVFTTVTIIFLPLSFFTGYFGMNIQGFANTSRTESDFWKLCGTVSFSITLIISLRHPIQRRITDDYLKAKTLSI